MSARKRSWIAVSFGVLLGLGSAHLHQVWVERRSRGPAPAAFQCRSNLRTIDTVKNIWTLEHQNDVPAWDDLRRYLSQRGDSMPKCPSGGSYTIGGLDELPKCSYPRHTMQ
jgi:hypothetical protein